MLLYVNKDLDKVDLKKNNSFPRAWLGALEPPPCQKRRPRDSQHPLGPDTFPESQSKTREASTRPSDTAKLEKRLPQPGKGPPRWPSILKRLEFLAEQEGLGAVPGQSSSAPGRAPGHPSRPCPACCPSTAPEGWGQPPGGQRREADGAFCPQSKLAGEGSNTPAPTQLPKQALGQVPWRFTETLTEPGDGFTAPERARESGTGQSVGFEPDLGLLAQCPFPHTRRGSQSLAGGGIFHRVGSKQELSRAGPVTQRDCLSLWLVAQAEAAAAGGSLSKGNPAPQVRTSPLPSG